MKVLLIEDNDTDAMLLARLAKKSTFPYIELARTASISQGIAYLKQHKPDAILLDLSLPDSVGLSGLAKIREVVSDIPVVILTGLNNDDTGLEAVKHGAQDYISKDGLSTQFSVARALLYAAERQELLANLKKVTLDLSTQKTFLQSVLSNMGESVIVVDQNRIVILSNPSAERLLGLSLNGILIKEIALVHSFYHEDEETPFSANELPSARALKGEVVNGEGITIKNEATGEMTSVVSSAAPIRDASGQITGAVIVFRDITILKKSEKAAKAGMKMKSDFLAMMSHEIRTPINGIIGMADLLLDTALTAEQRDYLETIDRSSDSLLIIINDILDFSKIEAGKMALESVDFDLRQMAADLIKTFELATKKKGTQLVCDIDSNVAPFYRGDSGRVRQVLTNFLSNAIKFTVEGNIQIRIRADATSGAQTKLHFEVQDSGIGISEETQSRLFQAFSQADSSTTRRYGGTGLGLAISKRIVGLMNGAIGVKSAEGEGSTFWFYAMLENSQKITPDADGSRKPKQSLKGFENTLILVADDTAVNQKIALIMLNKMGIKAHAVANGNEVLSALRKTRYDLILMDGQMPDLDGYEATKLIRKGAVPGCENIPIIAITADVLKGDMEKCLDVGMNDYLAKPIKTHALAEMLEKHLLLAATSIASTTRKVA